ncbi:MAG TPA: sigma-70 family RNA polymerase sigma factor [Kofleriaceae bacterium]|jgi:RNA polymerase sigma-70 factor (ECF subfamily)
MMGQLVALHRVSGETTDLSDEALLAACATGDRAALGAFFDRFHAAVYRFVSRLRTVDEMSRDDVVQATFLDVPRIATEFNGLSTVKTWLLGVASNLALHHSRGEQRRRVRQGTFAAAPPSEAKRPDLELDRRRTLGRIAEAVARLPHDQQVAFILCDLEHVRGVDVARTLGIPEGTLWRRLHAARKAVRAAVGGVS